MLYLLKEVVVYPWRGIAALSPCHGPSSDIPPFPRISCAFSCITYVSTLQVLGSKYLHIRWLTKTRTQWVSLQSREESDERRGKHWHVWVCSMPTRAPLIPWNTVQLGYKALSLFANPELPHSLIPTAAELMALITASIRLDYILIKYVQV